MKLHRNFSHRVAVLSLFLLAGPRVPADDAEQRAAVDDPTLTIERIYDDGEFAAESFVGRWLPEGSSYSVLEDSDSAAGVKNIVRVDAATGEKSVLVDGGLLKANDEASPLKIEEYEFSDDLSQLLIFTNSKRVWRRKTRGDYWVYDRGSRQLRQLGGNAEPSSLMFAKFSPDSRYVAYLIDADIYIEHLRDGTQTRLTTRTSDTVINGTFDWVYEEELNLRNGYRWSPDSRSIAYWQLDTQGVPIFTMINNTDSLYPKLIQFAHPKVGQKNAMARIGIVDIRSAKTKWIKTPGDRRDDYLARMEWTPSGELVIQQLNRLQNSVSVLLTKSSSAADSSAADSGATDTSAADSGAADTSAADSVGETGVGETGVEEVFSEQDTAWIDVRDEMKWLTDRERFIWSSERDGWRHLYVVSANGGKARLITPGDYDVIEMVHVDKSSEHVYFIASPDNATERYLYRTPIDPDAVSGLEQVHAERVTPDAALPGTHSYRISANGRFAIHRFSNMTTPPVIELVSLPEHKTVRSLEENADLKKKLAEIDFQPTEFFRVDIGEDIELDAWCIQPAGLDVKSDSAHPLLVYVYGEPAGSTVVNRWGGDRYLWHQMMAQRGYCVMSFDNRGTKVPRGRAWRKSIYRRVGILAPNDQAAAVRSVLASRTYLDPDRVGVWGWSGGGSMTLAAMFKHPDLYKAGISIAPVPNQRYYDSIYQERYMGLPDDNVEGYTNGSAINFAHQLKGNLLLVHGTGDDNCHYQMTEMLINELIRHKKQFSMMAYPNRTHAIREGDGTTSHLRRLMAQFVEDNL